MPVRTPEHPIYKRTQKRVQLVFILYLCHPLAQFERKGTKKK